MLKTLRSLAATLLVILFHSTVFAQFEIVEYSRQNGWFNNGQPLPAESNLIITGSLPPNTDRVDIALFKADQAGDKSPLYSAVWNREARNAEELFRVPLSYSLKGSNSYDVQITYYSLLSDGEREQLRKRIAGELDRFLGQFAFSATKEQSLVTSPRKMEDAMNDIVLSSLKQVQTTRPGGFTGFSPTVRQALENLKDLEGSTPVQNASETQVARNQAFTDQLNEVKNIVSAELTDFLSQPVLMVSDVRVISNYPTEDTRNTIAINAGYGGVYLSGNLQDLAYGASPYVGISLPLSGRSSAPAILKNSSVSVGVFTNNFESEDGNTISGPIFGRPYYVGVGYKLFRFVRLNAGATALETRGSSTVGGGSAGLDVNAICIRPFVGLSAEIDLWVGLRNR